jgi:protoheme IX farnesyltransferase
MRMIPVLDRDGGHMTARLIINHILLLIPASLGPVLAGMAGPRYLFAATVLGALFLFTGFGFLLRPTDRRARYILWASLAYLPIVLTLLLLDGSFLVMVTS